ncbi:MAG: TlpA disulfide reductase family protein [Acidimicrobiia bacterium]
MKHPVRWIAGIAALVVVVFGVVLALNVGSDADPVSSSPLLDKAVPAFDLPMLDGTRITDTDLQGKWTVVNFWNTWCVPCQEELPELKKFVKAHAGDDSVQMLGIVRDPQEPKAIIEKYAEATGMDWKLALDPGSKAALDRDAVSPSRSSSRRTVGCSCTSTDRSRPRSSTARFAAAGGRSRDRRRPGLHGLRAGLAGLGPPLGAVDRARGRRWSSPWRSWCGRAVSSRPPSGRRHSRRS